MSTNFAIFGIGFVAFMFVGFPLAFGGFSYPGYFGLDTPMNADPLIGSGNWSFLWYGWDHLSDAATPALLAFFLYMTAFMDTVATIPTGSMAERWKWKSFVIWGLFCGAIYYPLFAAWTWGGGWLGKTWDTMGLGAGYVDFAGSGVVHAVGGVAALAGAIVLGRVAASTAPTASRVLSPATTSRWPSPAASSCCSVGSASTLPRRSRRATSSSPPSPPTRPSLPQSAPRLPCSG
jgi:ammonia channel protein AmtB